jgi:hypothetical protein
VLTNIAVEPRWDHTEGGESETGITLATELRLWEEPYDDWVQVNVHIPSAWKAKGQQGDWASFYFLTHTKAIRFDLELRQLDPTEPVVQLPVLVQTGGRQAWLTIYLQSMDHGFCVALARLDEQGRPLWFTGHLPDGSDRGYWSFLSTVSESLHFVEQVLEVDIHPPSYLSSWCGVGTRAGSVEQLVETLCSRAGCVVQTMGGGEYLVDFARGYTGGPDASWFVLGRDDRFTIAANGGIAADVLVPALLEAAGAVLGPSPDLADSTVYCSWTGSFRGALEAVCTAAQPALIWEERAGEYVFSVQDRRGERAPVQSD